MQCILGCAQLQKCAWTFSKHHLPKSRACQLSTDLRLSGGVENNVSKTMHTYVTEIQREK